jgi:hypothetical protein
VIIDPEQRNRWLPLFKAAGVSWLWLHGYFFGHWVSSFEEMQKARHILLEWGFQTGIVNIPVGHPGNSLDPDDPTQILTLPDHWRYRIDRHGNRVLYCAEIEEKMIYDNVEAVRQLADLGFTAVFFDDDLRQGNWGQEIQGCFCEKCIAKFNQQYSNALKRNQLSSIIEQKQDCPEIRDWIDFTCQIVANFVFAIEKVGIQLGIMVMHNGDERHGIDIPRIKNFSPNCWFRVGENHFSDRSFNTSLGKAHEITSIQNHLQLMLPNRTFSETTVFPPNALSPQNWLVKMQLAWLTGVSDIFLMGGTRIPDPKYWQMIREKRYILDSIFSEIPATNPRPLPTYSIHILNLNLQALPEPLEASPLGVLGGLPACPLRNLYQNQSVEIAILIIEGNGRFSDKVALHLNRYQTIFCNRKCYRINQEIFTRFSGEMKIFSLKSQFKSPQYRGLSEIRHYLENHNVNFPFISKGQHLALFWYKSLKKVVVFNLDGKSQAGIINISKKQIPIRLEPLEIKFFSIND